MPSRDHKTTGCIPLLGFPLGKNGFLMSEQQSNGSTESGRDGATGRFLRGHRSKGGRPLGSRNKLAEKFLADLQRQWMKSGKKALERTAEEDPVAFTKIVAGLMPKELDATLSVNVDLFARARTRLEAYRIARDFIGAEDEPPLIEAQPIEVENE
jgi:hypothetical protein